jgi:hypothetical protein
VTTATFAAPSTRPRRSNVADAVLAAAVDLARAAAEEDAGAGEVGDHLGVRAEDQRLVTHYFASTARGYVGWRWAVTLARPPRARTGTVCEVALLPGDEAIVAPEWLPWSERLKPGDIGRDDVLPYVEDDHRLEPGFEETGEADVDRLAIDELGLGRVRVLSPLGRDEAATRWYSGDRGPVRAATRGTSRAGERRSRPRASTPHCATCGFLMLMAGSMRTLFGVCSNEWSPDDGRVVSLDHGCGAHSESDVEQTPSEWPANAPVVDELGIDFLERPADEATADPSRAAGAGAEPSPEAEAAPDEDAAGPGLSAVERAEPGPVDDEAAPDEDAAGPGLSAVERAEPGPVDDEAAPDTP